MFYCNIIDLFYYLYIKKVNLLLLILIVFYIIKIRVQDNCSKTKINFIKKRK